MTVPADLAPSLASTDPSDFALPQGREEEWRFAPLPRFSAFMEPADALCVEADGPMVRTVPAEEVVANWVPTDRPSAVAWSGAGRVVLVEIPDETSVAEPIVVLLRRPSGAVAYERLEIRAGRGSRATVVVEQDTTGDVSGAAIVTVGADADLTVLNVVEGRGALHLHWPVSLGQGARFTGCQLTLAGDAVRILPTVTYQGPGASAELLGAFLADGEDYCEHRIFVHHSVPHCTSRVVYKGALSGASAHSVWIGDVLVRREAVGTDTYELNRNLLLNDGPRADSVPNLELETGDVAGAGHASATGRFDDDQLFYLMSRGIPETTARQLVVRGFFAEILQRLGQSDLADRLAVRIGSRLGMAESLTDE